jgi:arylsulfatase A-like enzyme
MDRRDFLKRTGIGAALALAGRAGRTHGRVSDDRPNIIFIIVDDMGWADLGCYGSRQIHTPNIDKMARDGIRFTQAYSGCTVCAPARSVLMTGLHMGHTPVRGNTGGIPLPDDAVTVAEVLKKAGYATGGFGKWGLGDVRTTGVPERQGFDEFFGYYHQVHAHYYWTDYLWRNSEAVPLTGDEGSAARYSHYHIVNRMMDFIRRNKGRRFFCYAPWTPPHGRYEMPADDPAWQLYKDRPWPVQAKVVAAMDTMIDRHVGELMALVKELGIDERTVVLFCSDNGAAERFDGVLDSSGPLRGRKRALYEGGIRTPLIARWPGRIRAGAVSSHACFFGDVLPTLAELAGATQHVPANVDGLSMVPELLGRQAAGRGQKAHEYLYWEWHRYNWGKRQFVPGGLMQAVRAGRWKLVRHRSDKPWELYDLSKDLGEKTDLAGGRPEALARLAGYAKQARVEPRPQIEPPKPAGKRYR